MLGDRPVAAVVEAATLARRLFDPADRLCFAQLGELLDRQALDVDVGVEKVEPGLD
ncbi:hypothetical protein I553_5511 [Mycobacterium xenopi 4042]|uniref:Uncharacterized protein n=1 Tax=Mycobacterium xenopi 4042 TaxID=1299334 RepID=X7ZWW5_MYCXE|nr:hypothetical protein I553_5511 [Mycobacterium xenopi 4042]